MRRSERYMAMAWMTFLLFVILCAILYKLKETP